MRAMIILYIGPHIRPDFSTDFLLSPILAPEALLAKFPKTYFLTGERDPLVDDTVIFAGRLRQAKHNLFVQRKELGLLKSKDEFDEKDHVQVTLIPGISHGFLQFVSVFPEGWGHIYRCSRWMEDVFEASPSPSSYSRSPSSSFSRGGENHRHHRRVPTESSGDEDRPLDMSSSISREPGSGGVGDDGSDKRAAVPQQQPSRSVRRGKARVRPGVGRERSLVSLASEDDLLGRRMKGLAGGLMGMVEDGEGG